ncbi:tRNA pseudouridine synthase D [Gammaproteobacteria bacterium]
MIGMTNDTPAAVSTLTLDELPYAHGGPTATGIIRTIPDDFRVDEELRFAPEGAGEHWLLRVTKRGANTAWVARRLAQVAGMRPVDVGYAGLKDRHAVTTQWFSVRVPGKVEPDWSVLAAEGVEVWEAHRHRRKLPRGALKANRFTLRVRGITGERAMLETRLQQVAHAGVPNYFGPQRFGRGGNNLAQATALLADAVPGTASNTATEKCITRDSQQRGMYLSAARSHLFNKVLAARVTAGTWDQALAGDAMSLDGSRSVFRCLVPDAEIARRLAEGDIHPTGPLWGIGERMVEGVTAALEETILTPWRSFCAALEAKEVTAERRALRLWPRDLTWHWEEVRELDTIREDLVLRFALPPGAYATIVLREVLAVIDAEGGETSEED